VEAYKEGTKVCSKDQSHFGVMEYWSDGVMGNEEKQKPGVPKA
jgi:hypothetical protein